MGLEVVPRAFTGRLLREIGPIGTPDGTVEVELYVGEAQAENRVALFRNGTRVVPDIIRLQGAGARAVDLRPATRADRRAVSAAHPRHPRRGGVRRALRGPVPGTGRRARNRLLGANRTPSG